MSNFGKNLNDLLRIKHISQTKLGDVLGVKQNTVSQWATGKREPDYDTLLKICVILDTEPSEILGFQRVKNDLK